MLAPTSPLAPSAGIWRHAQEEGMFHVALDRPEGSVCPRLLRDQAGYCFSV